MSSLLITVLICTNPQLGGSATVADAIDLLDGATRSIQSFDIRATVTYRAYIRVVKDQAGSLRPRKPLPGDKEALRKYYFRQVYDRGRGRIEYLESPTSDPNAIIVYSPEVEKAINFSAKQGSIRDPLASLAIEGGDYRETFMTVYGRSGIVPCLRERENVTVRRSGPKGKDLVLETLPPGPGSKPGFPLWGFRIRLDASRGMMPCEIERLQLVDGKPVLARKLEVTDWKKLDGGVWAPTKAKCQGFSASEEDRHLLGELWGEAELSIDVGRSTWNKPIPEAEFEIGFPPGYRVDDMRRRVSVITGSANPEKNLDNLLESAREVVEINVPEFHPARQRFPLWLLVCSGALGVLAIGSLSYLLYRRSANRVLP